PALIPVITVMGMQIALSLGGAVLTETTFEWNGLGFVLVQYMQARDFVAVQGIVMLMAVIVAVTNFIVDIIAALIDPRVRFYQSWLQHIFPRNNRAGSACPLSKMSFAPPGCSARC